MNKVFIFFMYCLGGLIFPVLSHGQITTPNDVSGLVMWVDGKDVAGTGTQPVNGSLVTTWADKSGNGNDLIAPTGLEPTFESTGFDGVNPGLRFPNGKKLSAATPFSTTYDDTVSVFFVNANVTRTNNFSLNLNGDNSSTDTANGRFSFHTPWGNGNIYFDGGACCGSTRLTGAFPNATTETTLITGVNDLPGFRQLLRIDGAAFRADSTGLNANMSGGVRVGSTSGNPYDGRFAEIVIYDRALTQSEIEDVECFLLLKWKAASAPSGCAVPTVLSATKNVEIWDPDGLGLYGLPGNDVIYSINVKHESGGAVDTDTLFLVDSIPEEVLFYNADIDDLGPELNPVKFTETSSGLTFTYATDIGYSNAAAKPAAMIDCSYLPTAGYDSNVRHICIAPKGSFQPGSPSPFFQVEFRAKVD